MATKICENCKSTFKRNPKFGRLQWESVKTCSVDCSNKLRATHGLRKTRLYGIWAGVKQRCLNENCKEYPYYGLRGITICDEWKDNFQSFYDYVKPYPGSDFELGRIDNDKNYEPGNVEWQTASKNMQNT